MDIITNQGEKHICFIDKFNVPKNSINEFTQRMNYNRNFVKSLDGFVKSEAYQKKDQEGNFIIMTIAEWKSQNYLNKAKELVQTEFQRINFNPNEFYQALNVTLERGLYVILTD